MIYVGRGSHRVQTELTWTPRGIQVGSYDPGWRHTIRVGVRRSVWASGGPGRQTVQIGVRRPRPRAVRSRPRSGTRTPARPGTAGGAPRSPGRWCRARPPSRRPAGWPSAFGRSTRPSRWASSWREPKVPETWMATVASGRSMEKLATFETTRTDSSPCRKASKSFSRCALVVSPLMTGASRCSPSSSSWSMYWPMTSVCCALVLGHQGLRDPLFGGGGGAVAVLLLGLGGRVREPLGVGQVDADLDAVGGRDVALRLDLLPGRVEALGADEREDVGLAAVLAYERGGQAEPPPCLQSAVNLKTGAGSRCTSS
jgi:hypothetical protein